LDERRPLQWFGAFGPESATESSQVSRVTAAHRHKYIHRSRNRERERKRKREVPLWYRPAAAASLPEQKPASESADHNNTGDPNRMIDHAVEGERTSERVSLWRMAVAWAAMLVARCGCTFQPFSASDIAGST
jgi:hypothetical protein